MAKNTFQEFISTFARDNSRPFNKSELAQLANISEESGHFLWSEEVYLESQVGDRLFPLDNAGKTTYIVWWGTGDFATKGEFTVFTNLKHAIQVMQISG